MCCMVLKAKGFDFPFSISRKTIGTLRRGRCDKTSSTCRPATYRPEVHALPEGAHLLNSSTTSNGRSREVPEVGRANDKLILERGSGNGPRTPTGGSPRTG